MPRRSARIAAKKQTKESTVNTIKGYEQAATDHHGQVKSRQPSRHSQTVTQKQGARSSGEQQIKQVGIAAKSTAEPSSLKTKPARRVNKSKPPFSKAETNEVPTSQISRQKTGAAKEQHQPSQTKDPQNRINTNHNSLGRPLVSRRTAQPHGSKQAVSRDVQTSRQADVSQPLTMLQYLTGTV